MDKITKVKKVKSIWFTIYEDGKRRKLSLDELIEFEKQGYIMEIRLVKPEVVKELSIGFEITKEE